MAKLTVAMDARYLAGERKGIGRYCHTLLSGISSLPDPPAFIFISDREFEAAYPGLAYETHVIEAWPVYSWEQIRLPRLLRRLDADLFHAPGNALPLRPPRPTVLTLHDMMMFERRFHTGEANRYYLYQSWLLRRAVRKCEAVITVSWTSAEDIRRRLGPGAMQRLAVIEEAVDPIFFETRSASDLASFRERLGLPDRYLLHLGAAFPRKNTRLTMEAYKLASQREELPPLVVGGVAAADEATLRGWAEEVGLGGWLYLQPYLPPEGHASLVAAAEVLVYPSAYEGFGLPALEAMAVGVPVIASRRGALPETCGEAAHYVEPEVGELAEALQFLTEEDERRRLAAAGRSRVAHFSPARMAERTLEVYREAVAAAKS
ncbi:MAG: glycosyltransferase family 4 protein [Candidatus Coatesbacteria bacterium]|nr:MAG: glycosyltransferase family 4 protein [Candidatus Coatesbacteria bacterium]